MYLSDKLFYYTYLNVKFVFNTYHSVNFSIKLVF